MLEGKSLSHALYKESVTEDFLLHVAVGEDRYVIELEKAISYNWTAMPTNIFMNLQKFCYLSVL